MTSTAVLRTFLLAFVGLSIVGVVFGKDVATRVAEMDVPTLAGALDFSPDGTQLAVDFWGNGGTDIWNVKEKRIVAHLAEGGSGTFANQLIAYSPNSRLLAICHGQITVYDTATWEVTHSIGDSCTGIAFTPNDGQLVVLSGVHTLDAPGNNVKFFDTSSWMLNRGIRTMPFVTRNCGPTTPPPEMVFTNPSDKSVYFDPATWGVLAFSKDGRLLGLTGTSGFICQRGADQGDRHQIIEVINVRDHTVTQIIRGAASSLDWNPDGIHLAAAMNDAKYNFRVFDAHSGEAVASEEAKPQHTLVKYTPDGKYLIEATQRKVEIWDGRHERLLQTINAGPMCLAVSPDGHFFAIGGGDNNLLDANPLVGLVTHPRGGKGKAIVYKLQH